MGKYPIIKPKILLKALLRAGFYVHHNTGSHARLLHKLHKNLRVTVPIHDKDLPIVTLKCILQQANLDIKSLRKFL